MGIFSVIFNFPFQRNVKIYKGEENYREFLMLLVKHVIFSCSCHVTMNAFMCSENKNAKWKYFIFLQDY